MSKPTSYGSIPPLDRKGSSAAHTHGHSPSNVAVFPKSPFMHTLQRRSGSAVALGREERSEGLLELLHELIIAPQGVFYYLKFLLLCIPFSLPSYYFDWNPGLTFSLGFFSLIPLAALLGDLTEDLANSLGDTWGALLNVTFGNATEVIICIMAIQYQMFDIIKASMLGSILGNMLLVLGSAFVVAGFRSGEKGFRLNRLGGAIYSALLLLSCFGLIVPTALAHLTHNQGGSVEQSLIPLYRQQEGEHVVLLVSRYVSVTMVVCYLVFIYYQARYTSHFEDTEGKDAEEGKPLKEDENGDEDSESDDNEEAVFPVWFAVTGLAIVTILVSFESEFVVATLEPTAAQWGISKSFIAVVLLPLVGNVCEHASAVMMAWKLRMKVAIGVAVGSSIQIATFVVPVLVLYSWAVNGENPPARNKQGNPGALDLNFHPFCTILMITSVLVVNIVMTVKQGTWVMGLYLLVSYLMICIAYWFVPADVEII